MPLLSKTQFPLQITGFDALYGLQILSLGDEEATAEVKVRDDILQPAGLVHGGVFASIAESLTSFATWQAVSREGKSAQGLSNQTSFLRPIVGGTIHAIARRRHKGRTTWVWEVDITDDEGRVCALVRMTVAVREAPRRVTRPQANEGGPAMAQQTKAERQASGQKAAATRQKNEAQDSATEAKKAAGEAVEALVTAAKAGGKAAVQAGKSVSNRAKARKS